MDSIFVETDDNGVAGTECVQGWLVSVNKMLRSLSNVGLGFCRVRSRVSREVWVSNSAWWDGGGLALRSQELLLVAFWSRARRAGGGEGDLGDR